MHQRPKVIQKKSAKPSLLLAFIGLMASIVISYFLINGHFYKKAAHYANKPLSLPEMNSDEDDTNPSPEENAWTIIETHAGDSLASVFKKAGLSRQTLQAVLNNNPHAKKLANLKPNQQIQLLIENQVLEKLVFPISTTQFLVVSREGKNYAAKIKSRKMDSHQDYVTATVRGSLYGTAKRMHIPYSLIRQMSDIFNWQIDFIKDIRVGDQFTILYEANYIDDKLVSTGDILAVTYTNRGKRYQAIRHESLSGDVDYFTPKGESLKKAFSRYPIQFSHISSTYSLSRKHPILHYSRPHRGVDLAASIGTPVHATGNGRVAMIGRQNGYGNMVKVVHDKTYSSIYGHLLKFQKGLAKGDRVKRGQVIGYVGQSGLATGPHCHYELHINHQPKNPSTVLLPRAAPVSKRELASFLARSNTLLAQLKLYEDASLAAIGKKSADTA